MLKRSLKLLKFLPKQTISNARQLSFNTQKFGFCSKTEDLNKPEIKLEITQENVHEVIDKWVKENKVVLFMKGVPQMPQCGYSNFVVEILKFYSNFKFQTEIDDYKGVDILKNNIVRENVKKYSNWPTYPQLYIDGQLLGGCDIISEMHKEGTLREEFVKAGLIQ